MTDLKNNVNESMLDLFILEVDTHSRKILDLSKSLDQENEIGATYEALINASRAIKGAAKLVHIDIASELIEVFESTFSDLQEKNSVLDNNAIDLITNSISLLKNIANLSAEELNTPSDELSNNIESIRQQFKELLVSNGHSALKNTTQESSEKAKIEPTANTTFEVVDVIDAEMFSLFLIELQNSLHAIGNNLLEIEDNPGDETLLEAMMRAAHSIKGAARMIGIEAVVKLSHSMEDVFVAAQKHQISLEKNSIDRKSVV